MGEVRKVDVSLSDELAAAVDAAISAGDYRDLSEFVSEMLQSWQLSQTSDSDRLRGLWEDGLASGEPIPGGFDPKDIQRRGLERLQALGNR